MNRSIPSGILEGDDCPQLSTLTTLEMGGKPQYYTKVMTEEEAIEAIRWAKRNQLNLRVIGGGSNIVIDELVPAGLILQLALETITWGNQSSCGDATNLERCQINIGAGVIWSDFVEESVKRGLAGVECLVGIPGWVGAAPIQNIGAYGQSFSDHCLGVRVYDLQLDQLEYWGVNRCQFEYRNSIFKRSEGRYLIFEVSLSLVPGGEPTLRYPQLLNRLIDIERDNAPSLVEVCEMVKQLRAEKSMIWNINDPNRRSVGSFFMNPTLSPSVIEALDQRCLYQGLIVPPRFLNDQGYKVPAAWLIEQSGFEKGYTQGQVGLSSRHCLALINHGGGTYDELLQLAEEIQRKVWSRFRVWLTPEAQLLSDRTNPLCFRPRIALATCDGLPAWEVDDHPLWNALTALGFTLFHPSWDDSEFDWGTCDLVIPRTTWDYQGKWGFFLKWMRHVDEVSTLCNPLELMEWNLDKRYLKDLNISQPPTHWLTQRSLDALNLQAVTQEVIDHCRSQGWEKAFLKPSIAASAIGTLRFSLDHPEVDVQIRQHLSVWLTERTMILQSYVEDVETTGECSLIYFGGQFSHAVRKVPVSGDYRVQDDYGATDMPWTPPFTWREACQKLVDGLPHKTLYARCDLLHSPDGLPWLIELELIEPSLFFRHDPHSPLRLAKAIQHVLSTPGI